MSKAIATQTSMAKTTAASGQLFACLLLSLTLLTVTTGAANAASVAGVKLEESISVNDDVTLELNGAGIRKRLFLKLYVGSLYVTETMKGADAQDIISADDDMLVQMNIRSKLLTRDKMVDAINSGLRKSTGGNTGPIQEQIVAMESALDEALAPGDVIQISYNAQTDTTTMLKNGEPKAEMSGLEFKQAMFGIWLSNDPVQGKLKKAMLGG